MNSKLVLTVGLLMGVPGAASSADPTPALQESKQESPQLDLGRLRDAVRSGDADRVADVSGQTVPEIAEDLYMLISEIPGDASRSDRKRIIKSLMKLLRSIQGETSSLLLMHSLRRDGFIPLSEWLCVVRELAKRGHTGMYPYLETVAFGSMDQSRYYEGRSRVFEAAEVLVKKDAERYVPALVQRVRTSTGSVFSGYLDALAQVPESAHPDIGKLIPHLRERYRELPAGPLDRQRILEVATNYAIGSKSESLRRWLMAELTKDERANEDEFSNEFMKFVREFLLIRLERASD